MFYQSNSKGNRQSGDWSKNVAVNIVSGSAVWMNESEWNDSALEDAAERGPVHVRTTNILLICIFHLRYPEYDVFPQLLKF